MVRVFIVCSAYIIGSMLDENAKALVTSLFRGYYEHIEIGDRHVGEREFGFGDFEKKISFRHYSFGSTAALKKYIVENVPAFISYSPAFYKMPSARPMERKGWIGAELVFDLDAGDLHLDCQKQHSKAWVCSNCLEKVKLETLKLVEDFLIPDFGFSAKEISVNFSGNRGYHVHVNSDSVYQLRSKEREAITDYISGKKVNPNWFFPSIGKRTARLFGPKPSDFGWGGRFAGAVIKGINGGAESLILMGIDKKAAKNLEAKKADVVFGISNGNWDKVAIPKKDEFWKDAISRIAPSLGCAVDKNVTNDIHHLIRMPETLHGDTGLAGKIINSVSVLQKFDPMEDAIVFNRGELTVEADLPYKFRMGGREYGPYDKQKVELPLNAAVYLILKRAAKIAT